MPAAFSLFGDITSLMVWQKGKLGFFEFFYLFLPSLVNFLVPATLRISACRKERRRYRVMSGSLASAGQS